MCCKRARSRRISTLVGTQIYISRALEFRLPCIRAFLLHCSPPFQPLLNVCVLFPPTPFTYCTQHASFARHWRRSGRHRLLHRRIASKPPRRPWGAMARRRSRQRETEGGRSRAESSSAANVTMDQCLGQRTPADSYASTRAARRLPLGRRAALHRAQR